MREVNRLLRTYCHQNHTDWIKYLHKIEEIINVSHHDSIDSTPHQAMYGKKPTRLIERLIQFPEQYIQSPDDIHDKITRHLILKAKQRKIKRDKKNIKSIQYEIGQKVLVKNHKLPSSQDHIMKKLILLYDGPYMVINKKGNNVYEIGHLTNKTHKGYFNCNQLKPYFKRDV